MMVALSREYLDAEFKVDHMQHYEHWTEELKTLSLANKHRDGEQLSGILCNNNYCYLTIISIWT